jgi:dCMP deaminase
MTGARTLSGDFFEEDETEEEIIAAFERGTPGFTAPPLSFPIIGLLPLSGKELEVAEKYLDIAALAATRATCLRSSCGAVVVKDGVVLGTGHNSLPGDCAPEVCLKEIGAIGAGFKSDRTCCTHAEIRAITIALKGHADVSGADVYFTRIDEEKNRVPSGRPYCTICSKFALEVGLQNFVLSHSFGVVAYPTDLYNNLSFTYGHSPTTDQ